MRSNREQSTLNQQAYVSFTPLMAWQLAAPHTWPASIMPVLVASAFAVATSNAPLSPMVLLLLVICVLMQSAVNTFNDYFDFMKGADSVEDNVEPSDSVLVYHHINPRCALYLAVGFLATAFLLGLIVVSKSGFIPLIIALVGALVVVLYSGGKTPVSYLPLGEVVSGFVMGGLIPLAVYQVLTGQLYFMVLLWSIPLIIGIGLIMMTNNTCDIEKDRVVGRKTLPVVLGRKRARNVYHGLLVIWIVSMCAIVATKFFPGLMVMPFMLLAGYPLVRALWQNPLEAPTRIGAMAQIASINIALGAFFAAAVFV